jgi:hypothetical protein
MNMKGLARAYQRCKKKRVFYGGETAGVMETCPLGFVDGWLWSF